MADKERKIVKEPDVEEISEDDERVLEKFADGMLGEGVCIGFMEVRKQKRYENGKTGWPICGFIPLLKKMSEDDLYLALKELVYERHGANIYHLYPCDSEKHRIEGAFRVMEIEKNREDKELEEMGVKAEKLKAEREALGEEKKLEEAKQELAATKTGGGKKDGNEIESRFAGIEGAMARIVDKLDGGGGQNSIMLLIQQQAEKTESARKEAEDQRRHELDMYDKKISEERAREDKIREERRVEDERKRTEKREERERERKEKEEKIIEKEEKRLAYERIVSDRDEKTRNEEIRIRRDEEKYRNDQLKMEKDERERRIKILEDDARESRKERAERARRDADTQAELIKAINKKEENFTKTTSEMMLRNAEQQAALITNQVELSQRHMNDQLGLLNYIKESIGISEKDDNSTSLFNKLADGALKVIDKATGGQDLDQVAPALAEPQQGGNIIPAQKKPAKEGGNMLEMLMKVQPKLFSGIITKIIGAMQKDLPVAPYIGMMEEIGAEMGVQDTIITSVLGLEFDELKATLLGMKARDASGATVSFLSSQATKVIDSDGAVAWWDKFQQALEESLDESLEEEPEMEAEEMDEPELPAEPEGGEQNGAPLS